MRLQRADRTVFAYNYAAVLTGGCAVMRFGIDDRAVLFRLTLVFAFAWTVYFRVGMVPRLAPLVEASDREDLEA